MRIVHIEDESLLRDILRRGFKHAEVPIELHQFESGDDAMPFVVQNKQTIDLFILDIRLPGTLNGLQIAQRLREIGCPGSIVLTSAFYSSPDPNWLNTMKAEYLPKPWYVFEIAKKLRQYCLDSTPEPEETNGFSVAEVDPDATLQRPMAALLKGKNGAKPNGASFTVSISQEAERGDRQDLLDSLIDDTRPRRSDSIPLDI